MESFILGKQIGHGSFGTVFEATQSDKPMAVKIESHTRHPQLLYESRVLHILRGSIGIPKVYWFGEYKDCNAMSMELLGPSLEDLFQQRKFSLKTTLMVADQILSRLETIHSKCFIHRDVKPENFLVHQNVIHIVDFGLAMKYKHPKTNEHIPYSENKTMRGTPRYASRFAHMGVQQSRRDDLESLGYMLVYFCLGSLPWQNLGTKHILRKKMMTPCAKTLDKEFCEYFCYCDSLGFDETPDYEYLRQLFRTIFTRNNFVDDNKFDWTFQ
jgi:serine/threonine protein kinase